MSEQILIWPGVPGADALLAERQGEAVTTRRGPVASLVSGATPLRAVVLPGQLVRALMTDLPERLKQAERVSVARFAHEERLSVDPMSLHVVVGPGAPAPTRLIDPEVLRAVNAACDPAAIFADYDLLSADDGPVRLLDRVVVGGAEGYAVDPDWAEPGYAVPDDETLAGALFAALDRGDGINLRTGAFRRKQAIATGPWLRVAAAALVCGLLGLGVIGAEARAIQSQAGSLDAEARQLYQSRTGQAAPERLSSLARQSSVAGASSTEFLDLSNILFKAVAETPGTQVERLSYEADEGRLRLRLIYPNFDAAATLEQAVAQAGGVLTTGGVREQNGSFIGDAALAIGGAS